MSEWQEVMQRLDALEASMAERLSRMGEDWRLIREQQAKASRHEETFRMQQQQHYGTAEFACLVGRAEFTVREWCRHRRIDATKKLTGCGRAYAWVITAKELKRYQEEGLLPTQSPDDE